MAQKQLEVVIDIMRHCAVKQQNCCSITWLFKHRVYRTCKLCV